METQHHTIHNLFDQLGLPSESADIDAFIAEHRQLSGIDSLFDAPFWTESQAKFLHDQIKEDADWAVVIDKLDASLRI
jgi:hypothetical protein